MIEVRPITTVEAPTLLRLTCDVFDLDHQRASAVFFSEPFFDLRRKWALFDNGVMASCLTTTPLSFGFGKAFGVAGVATAPAYRHRGYAERLLTTVLDYGEETGEQPAMLFARDPRLYARLGFEVKDTVVRCPLATNEHWEDQQPMPTDEVKARYSEWEMASDARLRRDELRWKFWSWHFRVCFAFGDGYITTENGVLREAILEPHYSSLPLPRGTDWYGLRSMAACMQLPIEGETEEMHVMTRGFPVQPQMFLTDQF